MAVAAPAGVGCDRENGRHASPCKPSRLYLGAPVPYEPRVRILRAALLPLVLLVPSGALAQPSPGAAKAQPAAKAAPGAKAGDGKKIEFVKGPVGKAVGACGARILPLVEGNSWTYGFVASPMPPRADLAKLLPTQPEEVVITVKSVETSGPDTVVKLEEQITTDFSKAKDPKKPVIDKRTINTTITCNAKKFEISPDSFFFAGEPGGNFGVTFDKVERPKDTSWKLVNGTIGESKWREDIIATFSRTATKETGAKLAGGKLELEREFTPTAEERLNTKAGVYTAEHLVLTTTGRITLDPHHPDTKPMEIPEHWTNQLWLVPNAGVVQVLNAYGHMYTLVAAQLK